MDTLAVRQYYIAQAASWFGCIATSNNASRERVKQHALRKRS
jgi:hypothetical protein